MIRNDGALLGLVCIRAPRTVALMATNQVGSLLSHAGLGLGLGFETTDRFGTNGMDSEGAFGWGDAYAFMYRLNPQARMTILLMIKLIPNASDIRTVFPTLVYQLLMEPPNEWMSRRADESSARRLIRKR